MVGVLVYLLVGLCLFLGTGLLVLRSSWAERHLTAEIPAILNPILAEQGLSIELEKFAGPLPGRAALSGLRVYDKGGLFLEIDQIETKLALSDLFGGSFTVELAQVIRPSLYRLPEITPSPDDIKDETPSAGPGIGLDLPVNVLLDTIRVEGALIPWALLGHVPGKESPQGQTTSTLQNTNEGAGIATVQSVSPPPPSTTKPEASTQASTAPLSASQAALASTGEIQAAPLPDTVLTAQEKEKLYLLRDAWQQTLTTPLYLDIDATAQLAQGILEASLNLRARDGGVFPLSLNRTHPLLPADHGADAPPATLPVEASPHQSPGENFDLKLEFSPIRLVLVEPEFNTADITGRASLQLAKFSHELSLGVLAEINEQAANLAELKVQGLGLSLETSAQVLLGTGQPLANLSLSGNKTKDLQLLLAAITGQDPMLMGALLAPLSLEASVTHHQKDLLVDLRSLHAGTISAQGQAALSGLFQTDTVVTADNTDTSPLSDSTTAPPTGKEPSSPAGGGSEPSIPLAEPVPTQINPVVHPPLGVNATLSVRVDDLAALSPQAGGKVQAEVKIQGSLAALSTELVANSPNLVTSSGDLSDFSAHLATTMKQGTNGSTSLQGNLKANAAPNALGPTDVSLAWNAFIPATDENGVPAEALKASVDKLRIAIFGMDINGSLQASASPAFLQSSQQSGNGPSVKAPSTSTTAESPMGNNTETNSPPGAFSTAPATAPELLWPTGLALNGHAEVTVGDWEPLSLFAQTPLKGKDTRLLVALKNTGGEQSFELEAKSEVFSAPEHGAALNGLNLSGRALLPIHKGSFPQINLHLTTGKGEAANIPWNAITATIDGDSGKGNFSFLVEEDQQKIANKKAVAAQKGKPSAKPSSASGQGNSHFTSVLLANELLSVNGLYDLQNMAFRLEKLALKEPFSQTQVQLRDPAAISLKDGFELADLTLDVSSGGALSAQAKKTATTLQAKATIADLPLALINDVAGTALPPGHIEADVTLQTGQHPPQGGVLLKLYLDDSQPKLSQTPQTHTGANHTAPADIRLDAAFVQAQGRSYLSGGLDFSQLATTGKRTTVQKSSAPIPLGASSAATRQAPATSMNVARQTQISPGQTQILAGQAPLTFHVPLTVKDGVPLPDMHGPFRANLSWRGALDGFWRLVPLPDTEFSALANINLGLSGTLGAPKTGGTAHIAQGRFYDKGAGLLLTDIALETHASTNDGYRLVLAASDGDKGTLGLEGALTLKDNPAINLRGQLKHLAPLHRDDVKITLTGLLGVKGPLDAPKVTADILVERGEIALLAAMGNGSVRTLPITDPDAEEKETLGPGGTLDVKVTIPRRFYIRGLGLDSEWGGALNINGGLSEPQLVGSLRPIRGYFELISKPFAFTGGEIVFAGGSKINPGLNLELTYSAPTLEAIIRAGGSLETPKLVLESNPPLPKDEVLAHVLFGKKLSELSRFEALQLANSMSELAGISNGNLNPLTSVRKATGFDVLRFGSDGDGQNQRQDSGMTGASNLAPSSQQGDSPASSAPTLEAGKYINDSIYIGVEQGITQESTGVRVEIELFPNTTLQGKTTSTSSSAGIGWKMDY